MKISVVTVCYNAVDLIESTIRSVLMQTWGDVEYIVIDGGSTDGTIDIINNYSDRISYWISEPDKGIYDAMNKGIKAATGDYINFMNAGDTFHDEKVIEKLVPFLNGKTVVSGNWRRCYSDGYFKLASPKCIEVFKVEMPICHQATFIDLRYHKKHYFNLNFRFSSDYDFFYKAWRNGEPFYFVEIIVVDFLEAQGASTNNITSSVLEREKAWHGEQNVLLRRLHLRYQILRIKTVKFLKKYFNHQA